ncbi:hypothetical protein [Bartonella grahamii]|uniref:Uncharacterized protein n=1 Tax=Bartonella grahamii TaxID=33045 RepID=A0A336NAN7_BARGR|nr:hypothetical protein [Bartonella grahamii]SSZ39398.1 Uncharacterised protein [Bartonella grahamii]
MYICKSDAEDLCCVYAFGMAWNVVRELGGCICEGRGLDEGAGALMREKRGCEDEGSVKGGEVWMKRRVH